MLRPIYLQPGDKVALISPAGVPKTDNIDYAVNLLLSLELIPVLSKHIYARNGQLAGTDLERLVDLQVMLDDEEIRAIWCTTGGYGTLRLVEEADYSTFQGNPKWIIGMDDITILHAKLHFLGIESLHAFMPEDYSMTSPEAMTQLRNFLFGIISSYSIPAHPLNRTGFAETEMVGGMLNWVHSLHDTSIDHNTRGTILFIEEKADNIYDIDRSIQCLKYAGQLQHLQGLIVGEFAENENPGFTEEVYHLIRKAVEEYSYPVCFGFPAGHIRNNFPVILGADTVLSVTPENCEIRFT